MNQINKRQKFTPLTALPFCLLFEENKEFWILGIHPSYTEVK